MRTASRAGFTLIEMMVAMALTLFIMVILSQAFVISLETFSRMKGIGDMQMNLRVATTLLREDLASDHFEGKRRLSDITTNGQSRIITEPLQAGHFAVLQRTRSSRQPWSPVTPYVVGDAVHIPATGVGYVCIQAHTGRNPATSPTFWQTPAPYYYEGLDANNMESYRATDHVLYLTVKRKGNRQENFFTASLNDPTVAALPTFFSKNTAYDILPVDMPSATTTLPYTGGTQAFYSSQWAEVIYYLKRTGSTEEPNNPTSNLGTPTFELYRAQFVMVPDGTELRKATTPAPNTNVFVAPPPTAPAAQFTQFDNWSRTIFHQMSTSVENVGVAGPRWELWFPSPAEAARGIRLLKNTGTVSGLTAFNTQIPVGTTYNPLTARVIVNEAPVLPNVLSFQVKTMAHVQPWDGATAYLANDIVWFNNISFRAIVGNTGQQPGSPQSNAWRQMLAPDVPLSPFAFADIPPSPMTSPVANRVRLYDTTLINVGLTNTFGGATTNRFGLKAIQITIRVFDHKTRQTRQVSIVQDL